jgi:hypothetical protein
MTPDDDALMSELQARLLSFRPPGGPGAPASPFAPLAATAAMNQTKVVALLQARVADILQAGRER